MTVIQGVILAITAAIAGIINALAGGGTLLTFPMLLFVGTSSIVANATSTLALVVGTFGSVYGFRNQIPAVRPWLKRFVPVSLLGGILGAVLLTHTKERTFARMVPFLLLFATLVFLGQNFFRRFAGLTRSSEIYTGSPRTPAVWVAIIFQFLVAVYGGYFGAGIGILMLASLGFLGLTNIHEMNALKNVLSSLINFIAATYFIYSGLIDWPKAGVMIVGAVCGYFWGAHYSQRIPQNRVRQIITAVGFVISAALFYRQFFR
jgi:uncharacterized membrane protein YfcA